MSDDRLADLSFAALRRANVARIPLFKNSRGELAHDEPDGTDWSPAQWLQAVVGELGEYANKRKKFERGDIGGDEFFKEAADELADVIVYLDILAYQLGIDLGGAVVNKWNAVSERVGCALRLESNPNHPAQSRDFTPHPIGEILRYDHGRTALFIVEKVEPASDPLKYRYYGRHCLGGDVGAYHKDCRLPDNVDLGIWFSKASFRERRRSHIAYPHQPREV